MLEYFWYAVGWTMGWMIVMGFQGLIWVKDLKNAAHDGWRRLSYSHGRNQEVLSTRPSSGP
jgi:hypothetical protein